MFFLHACELIPENIEEEQVILLAPHEDAIIATGDILFSWDEVEGATEYEFQLVAPSFAQTDSFVLDSTLVVVDSINYDADRITVNLPVGDYEWRVRAMNFGFETAFQQRVLSIE